MSYKEKLKEMKEEENKLTSQDFQKIEKKLTN